jgi:hypothetical protein
MWVLADKLADLETANRVMDKFVHFCTGMDEFPDTRCFKLVYDSTIKGSPLKSFLCALVICQDVVGGLDEPGDVPPEFFQDMAVELCRMKNDLFCNGNVKRVVGVDIPDLPLSRWHMHDGGERTPSNK